MECRLLLKGLGSRHASFAHGPFVVFLVVGIQGAFTTVLVLAMRDLTKVCVGILALELLTTNVTNLDPTAAGHFVAAVGFDKGSLTLWAGSNLGLGHGLFHLQAAFVLTGLLDDFFAS